MTLSPTRNGTRPPASAGPSPRGGFKAACSSWLSRSEPVGVRRMGLSTCTSSMGSQFKYLGSRSAFSSRTVSATCSGSSHSMKKKSPPGRFITKSSPRSQRLALLTMQHLPVRQNKTYRDATVPSPHRRQLVNDTHQYKARARGNGPRQLVREGQVQHGRLIDDNRVRGQRPVFVALKPEALPLHMPKLEQPVHRARRTAGGFPQPLRRPSRGARELHPQARSLEACQEQPQDGGLARAGPAGDDKNPVAQRVDHRLPLLGAQGQPRSPLGLRDRRFPARTAVQLPQQAPTVPQPEQRPGEPGFRAVKGVRVNPLPIGHGLLLGHEPP